MGLSQIPNEVIFCTNHKKKEGSGQTNNLPVLALQPVKDTGMAVAIPTPQIL